MEFESYRREETIDNWAEMREFFRAFPDHWIFRGQSDAEWSMRTSLERCEVPDLAGAEEFLRGEFKLKADLYVEARHKPTTELEWLALMQHHGAPTRLLDFTTSAYVAALFAMEGVRSEDGNCAVWAVNAKWCKQEANKRVSRFLSEEAVPQTPPLHSDALFNNCYLRNRICAAIPLQPTRFNQRLAIQQGCFLCPASVNESFAKNLYEQDDSKHNVIQIIIPGKLRAEVLEDLRQMNISRETLFPGLDGFAQSLGARVHSFGMEHLLDVRRELQRRFGL